MTKTPPTWVINQLITDGDLTPDRYTRHPQARRCPACGANTTAAIRSMSNEVVHCDPYPTTNEGEFLAAMAGRRTFFVSNYYGIETRFDFDILYLPADKCGQIHAEHQCGKPPLPKHPDFTPTQKKYLNTNNQPAPF